ncbi:MAG: hypothetical protein LW875_03945 [Proteobacteria bacterium]|jgi:hypothetical protein|nr:hypothetical protein [Pseudomonadota bacterium]
MKGHKTSRVLNDESYFLGLSYSDISGVGALLLGIICLLKALGIQNMLWALLFCGAFLVVLIPLRLGFRRKIIRDSLFYFLNHGVVHVSKNNRNK